MRKKYHEMKKDIANRPDLYEALSHILWIINTEWRFIKEK